MTWLTNTSDTDLELPLLGVTLRAGQSWEYDGDEEIHNPSIKVTKTKPSGADVDPWVPPPFEPTPEPDADPAPDPTPSEPAPAADTSEEN